MSEVNNTVNSNMNTNIGTICVEEVSVKGFTLKGLKVDMKVDQTNDTVRVYAGLAGDLIDHLKNLSNRATDYLIESSKERDQRSAERDKAREEREAKIDDARAKRYEAEANYWNERLNRDSNSNEEA